MFILCISQSTKHNKLMLVVASKIRLHCYPQEFNHKHLMYAKFQCFYLVYF